MPNWLVDHVVNQIISDNMRCAFCSKPGITTTIKNDNGERTLKIVCAQCIDSKLRQHGWIFEPVDATQIDTNDHLRRGSLVLLDAKSERVS